MSIMGEPIQKIPGVKPPIGLETRPASSPQLSPLQQKILTALASYAKADEDLGKDVTGRTVEVIARVLKESHESVAEAMGELFDMNLVVRPARGLWLAKEVKEFAPTYAPAAPETKSPPISETKPPVPETPVRGTPIDLRTLDWRRARLRDLAPNVGDRVVLITAFPKDSDRVTIGQEIKRWPEFSYTVDKMEGVQGRGRGVATRMHVDQTAEAKPKTEVVAENENYRIEAPTKVEVKAIPTRSEAPKLDALIQRAKAECDAKIQAAQLAYDAVRREATREFEARVEGITWAMTQMGGAA